MSKSAKNGEKADNQRDTTPQTVNREEVRMLVNSVGYAQASEATGIKQGTLRQWAARYNWNAPVHATVAKSLAVTNVTSPAIALASILAQDRDATKLGASKVARRVFEHLSEAPIPELMRHSRQARDYVDVGAKAQAWEAEQGNQGSLSLEVLTSEGAFRVVSTQGDGSGSSPEAL